jgi:hypothetical protein|tara:strand:- start:682 stop:975 length:294 start_codon:yes stop_codon:yes gene_type:complete
MIFEQGDQGRPRDAQSDTQELDQFEALIQKQVAQQRAYHGREAKGNGQHNRELSRFECRIEEYNSKTSRNQTATDCNEQDWFYADRFGLSPEWIGDY